MSVLLAVCTFAGTSFIGRPKPGSGALPMTTTWGNSWTLPEFRGASAASDSAAIAALP